MNDELASDFRDVDRAGDFALFANCLDLVAALPFFAEVKRESNERLAPAPGRRGLLISAGHNGHTGPAPAPRRTSLRSGAACNSPGTASP